MYLFQNATAISTQESADSTWNYTSYRVVSAEAFVCSAGILQQEDTVTIVGKVTTGIRRDRSNIVKPANVSTLRQPWIAANLKYLVPTDLLIGDYLLQSFACSWHVRSFPTNSTFYDQTRKNISINATYTLIDHRGRLHTNF